MGAVQPEQATIYIGVADVDPSTIASASATFDATGYITNFSMSGMEEDVESNPVFGGGNIDKIKPRTQGEVSFDVILQYGTDVTKFDEFKFGSTLKSSGDASSKAIALEFSDGTNYYSMAFNNVKAVTWEPEAAADDFLKGTITFKFSPTTSTGAANFEVGAVALASLDNWA